MTGFPSDSLSGKESACQSRRCRSHRRCGFGPWVGKIPWSRKWPPTPVLLSWKSHGQRSLVGYSPWALKESDTTELTKTTTNKQKQHNTRNMRGEIISGSIMRVTSGKTWRLPWALKDAPMWSMVTEGD